MNIHEPMFENSQIITKECDCNVILLKVKHGFLLDSDVHANLSICSVSPCMKPTKQL